VSNDDDAGAVARLVRALVQRRDPRSGAGFPGLASLSHWRRSPPPPRSHAPPQLILSVTGGAKSFHLPPRLAALLESGLLAVADRTRAWVVTGGSVRHHPPPPLAAGPHVRH
jgi:hypothetical protein